MLFLRYYLWVAPHILIAVLLAMTWSKGWHRRLPIFFSFALFEVVQFLSLFSLNELVSFHVASAFAVEAYRWILAMGLAVLSILQLGVLFELGDVLLLSRVSLRGNLRLVMRRAVAGLILVASVASACFASLELQRAPRVFEVLDFSSSLIQVGLLVILFVFSSTLQISWRSWPTGVALGFGISACINLGASALRAALGKPTFIAVDITQMAAFHVSVVVWLVYLFLPDRTPAFVGKGLDESDLQSWNQELQRMARQ